MKAIESQLPEFPKNVSQDSLLELFDEGWCLKNYIAVKERTTVGSSVRIELARRDNDIIINEFKKMPYGSSFLESVLNGDDISLRKKAVHILGEIGKDEILPEKQGIALKLAKRLMIEKEGGVTARLVYALDQIGNEAIRSLINNGHLYPAFNLEEYRKIVQIISP